MNDRLDELRRELPKLLVDRIESASGALDGAGDGDHPPDEVTELLGAISAGQELTYSLVSAELELRRLELELARPDRRAQGDKSPELESRITRLRTLRSQLVEGLSGLLGVLNTES